jgi:hypothetical protein
MGDSMSTIINATTTNGVVIQPDNSGSLVLQTNSGTTAVTIDTSQRVGIGTSSPSTFLHLSGANVSNTGQLKLESTDYSQFTFYNGATLRYQQYTDYSNNNTNFNNNSTNGSLIFGTGTSGTERMRIDSSGNLLIGTTTSSGNLVDIQASNGMRIAGWGSGIGTALTLRTTVSSTSDAISFVYNSTQIGKIQTTSTATSYVTSSDYRLKEDIAPMTGALDKVALLKPVTYKWKLNGSDGQGFIAHELQAVVPDCVSGEKDAVDKEGNIKPQGIDTSFLVATLTAAIQEQQTIINDLKARVETLEAK